METPGYAYNVFLKHLSNARLNSLSNKTILEIGPGDSLFTALIGKALGAKKIILVDAGDFASKDLRVYNAMAQFLLNQGYNLPNISKCNSVNDILTKCNAEYLYDGIDSYKKISSGSVDFIFSQVVFEHIRKSEIISTLKELNRIMSFDAISSHAIDLKDHLGNSLNNLRFSEKIWESDFFVKSGFYTNRIRYSQMLNLFEKVGFNFEVINKREWDKIPIKKKELATEFNKLSEDELKVKSFDVILRKKTNTR